jgi:hypothetical protein
LKKEHLLAGFKCKQLFHTFSGEADPSAVTAEEPANKYKEEWMNQKHISKHAKDPIF